MLAIKHAIDDDLWSIYAWWATVLILKMMVLTWNTGRIRVKYKVFHSEEDKMWADGPVILCPSGGGHPVVDRIRRVHHRDLRTVIPYLLLVPIWLTETPLGLLPRVILRLFPLSNILSTLACLEVPSKHPFKLGKISSYIQYCILIFITFSFLIHKW